MATSFLSNSDAKSLRSKESAGDSFEALKILLEQALSMANRLRVENSEITDVYHSINETLNVVARVEMAMLDRTHFPLEQIGRPERSNYAVNFGAEDINRSGM